MSRVAMYDVNVYANTLRDVLIRIDVIGLVQAKWTDRILEETFDNLKATRQDLSAQQLDWTRGLMNVAYLPRQSRRRQNSSSPRISTTSRCTWWPSSEVRKAIDVADRAGFTGTTTSGHVWDGLPAPSARNVFPSTRPGATPNAERDCSASSSTSTGATNEHLRVHLRTQPRDHRRRD